MTTDFFHKNFPLLRGLISTLIFIILFSCQNESEKESSSTIPDSNYLSNVQTGDSLKNIGLYADAKKNYEIAYNKAKSKGDEEQLVNMLIKMADINRLLGNVALAFENIKDAESLIDDAVSPASKLSLADVLQKKGLLLNDQGYFDSAIIALNSSIEYRSQVVGYQDSTQSITYNTLGISYFYKSQYDSALKYYEKAYNYALLRKLPQDADLAMYLQNIGIINAQKGEYDKAEEALTTSLKIYEKVLKNDDPELSMINLNVGRLKAILNKDLEALSYYNKAEEILIISSPSHPNFGYIYKNKGQTYVHLADYEKALIYFNKALSLAESSMEAHHPNILSLNMNIGYVYEQKKDYENALKYYLASLPEEEDSEASIKTYANLASLNNSLNNIKEADEYYRKAIDLSIKYLGREHPETGLLYTRYGYFLLFDPVNNSELEYFNKALAISIKNFGEKSREVSNNYMHIGSYYYTQNKIDQSLKNYQKAIIAIIPDFNNPDIYSNPEIENSDADRYLVNALNGKAEALRMLGTGMDLRHSLETYKLSIKVIDNLRSAYQDEESKLLISDLSNSTFQKTVDVGIKIYKATNDFNYLSEAFRYADKSKSAVLIRSIHEVESQHFTHIPKNILDLEKKLKLNVSTFRRLIYEQRQKSQPNENMIKSWESKVFENTVRIDSLANILEKEHPDYYKLKYTEPSINVAEIQKSLDNDRVLLEYMISDSILNIFAISQKSMDVFTVFIDSSFHKDIQAVVSATSNNSMFSATEKDFKSYAIAASRLYDLLMRPVTKSYNQKKITIIPDGEMGYLSFDLLLTGFPDTTMMDFRKLPYLINEKIISYSTSAILQFSDFRKRERKATKNFLAMAPSYENLTSSKEPVSFTDENGEKTYLLPIPGVENEIKGINKSVSLRKISGQDATERRFKEEAGQYNVLHLAMHTLINNNQPMLSKLVFSQNNDTLEDGLLNTYELFSMDLNAGLAVLSACNTGSGKLLEGEGIMNLARGFIYAGVPAIVMTMWSVDDQSSAEIVKSFYKYLRNGMPKDEALRQAKLDLLAQGDLLRSHPFYWAAYINVGDNSPMHFRNILLTRFLYGFSSLLIIGALLFLFNKKRKRKLMIAKQLA